MLQRFTNGFASAARVNNTFSRSFAQQAAQQDAQADKKAAGKEVTVNFKKPYKLHNLQDQSPSMTGTSTREDLLDYYRQMTLIRRLELAADDAYKARNIRGFLHLYNGQEAVAVGWDSVFTAKDHIVTAYRCHGWLLTKRCGSTAKEILAELFGKKTGCSHGKGGSMHMYNIPKHFYGGNGIVGAQVPLGAGLAWSEKYLKTGGVCLTAMGDGAINQGQVYESFNMATIHKLPLIFMIENNRYAMGTPIARGSATSEFYQRGNWIPGIQYDAQDVLQNREVAKFATEYVRNHGPLVVEAMTYRFVGHSVSDAGAYRTKDEVDREKKENDPLVRVRDTILEHNLATEAELKAITNEVREEIAEAVAFAKESPFPDPEELYTDVEVEPVPVRAVELVNSYIPK